MREVFNSYESTLDKEATWDIFRQIVEGLAHIHGQGILHRDLTPNNIFMSNGNDIKIGDFGLAKFTNLEQPDLDPNPSASADVTSGSLEGTGQVGTYFYTAPEIAQGWPHIDEKVCPQALRSRLLCCMKFQMLSESLLSYAVLFFCSVVVIPLSNCCSLVGHHIYDRPCSCFLVTSNELP